MPISLGMMRIIVGMRQHRPDDAADSAHHRRDDPHYHGHRDRLRARFSEAGGDALPDYELLELVRAQAL